LASLLAALVFAAPAQALVPQACALQVALKAHGFYKGPIDGIAGPQTKRGIRKFQHRKGLAVDGIAGPHTRAKLGKLGRPTLGKRLIHRGMVGWDVSVLQALLSTKGVRAGGLDGVFGARTRRAVLAFQQRRGLTVDGVVGPATIRALRTKGGRARHRLPHASPESISRSLNYWSRRYGVSRSLVRAVAWMESGFQNDVVSSTGAFGVMQIMPDTRSREPRTRTCASESSTCDTSCATSATTAGSPSPGGTRGRPRSSASGCTGRRARSCASCSRSSAACRNPRARDCDERCDGRS
jgi:hypothetical protein